MIDILLAHGHALFSELLASQAAEHGYRIVMRATVAREAVSLVAAVRPAICVVDPASFASDGGPRLVEELVLAGGSSVRVVVISHGAGSAFPRRMLDAGARGFVDEDCGMSTLFEALDLVMEGQAVVETAAESLPGPSAAVRAVHQRVTRLTPRERECLALIADGASTGDIARQLDVALPTVRSHVQSMLGKLGVRSRVEAASLAVGHGLVDEVGPASRSAGDRG